MQDDTTDKSSMLYWYPKIKDLDIPQPKTEMVVMKPRQTWDWGDFIDGKESIEEIKQIKDACNRIGYPVFIRTDQLSGKHDWENTCFVKGEDVLEMHLAALAEESLTADIVGLLINAIVIREYIPMDNLFTAFYGKMPVNPEIRFFIENGEVVCWHWYWIEEAIRNPSIENWKETIEKRQKELLDEVKTLKELCATEVARVFKDDGFWSVDFCRAKDGRWILIDLAEGEKSWHPEDCKFNRTPKIDFLKSSKIITEEDFVKTT